VRRWGLLAGAGVVGVPLVLAVLVSALSGQPDGGCGAGAAATPTGSTGAGSWVATAYGPPWGGINGDGVTATGLNLTSGPAVYEVAVDPRVIALRSYVHIEPNPFDTQRAFYAGDTGSAILGQHVDIYDWQGRAAQLAWGERAVTITPAPSPGAGNLLGAVPLTSSISGDASACLSGTLGLTAAQTAQIQPDGSALAPVSAPAAVDDVIAAGNAIHTLPYLWGGGHQSFNLAEDQAGVDCSGATSYLLHAARLLVAPLTSTQLEDWGQAGPGRWITVFANSAHTWIVVAGIALDTAEYGGVPVPVGSGPRWRAQPLANLADGQSYVVRHPAGL
jgi:3D (Asp-Asp-Asp) domain-containing protein